MQLHLTADVHGNHDAYRWLARPRLGHGEGTDASDEDDAGFGQTPHAKFSARWMSVPEND